MRLESRGLTALTTLALTALLTLWTTGCITRIQRPEVHLAGVRLGGLGLQGGTLYVRLAVNNPNTFALRASGLSYRVELREPEGRERAWNQLVEGVFESDLRVAAADSAIVEIPVEFRYSGLGTVLRSILDSGTFNYRVSGEVAVEQPIRTSLPYRHTGTANLITLE